jgi:heme/copper-type cytochrome/quinol oxidase subunit 4
MTIACGVYTRSMRAFSLMFAFIALVLLLELVLYLARGPGDLRVAAFIFAGFLVCIVPALYLLKPFGNKEDLARRREERHKRRSNGGRGS